MPCNRLPAHVMKHYCIGATYGVIAYSARNYDGALNNGHDASNVRPTGGCHVLPGHDMRIIKRRRAAAPHYGSNSSCAAAGAMPGRESTKRRYGAAAPSMWAGVSRAITGGKRDTCRDIGFLRLRKSHGDAILSGKSSKIARNIA